MKTPFEVGSKALPKLLIKLQEAQFLTLNRIQNPYIDFLSLVLLITKLNVIPQIVWIWLDELYKSVVQAYAEPHKEL